MYAIENSLVKDERGFVGIAISDKYPTYMHDKIESYNVNSSDYNNSMWYVITSNKSIQSGRMFRTGDAIAKWLYNKKISAYKVHESDFLSYLSKVSANQGSIDLALDMFSDFEKQRGSNSPIVYNKLTNELYFIVKKLDTFVFGNIEHENIYKFIDIVTSISNNKTTNTDKYYDSIFIYWCSSGFIDIHCKLYNFIMTNGLELLNKISCYTIDSIYNVIPINKNIPIEDILEKLDINPDDNMLAKIVEFYINNDKTSISFIESYNDEWYLTDEDLYIFIDANLDNYTDILKNIDYIFSMFAGDSYLVSEVIDYVCKSEHMTVDGLVEYIKSKNI